MEIDRESDDGWEKTMKYKGYRGHEKYNTKNKKGEIKIIVANRFIVESRGRNVDMDVIKAGLESVDLSKLEDMKDIGVKKN